MSKDKKIWSSKVNLVTKAELDSLKGKGPLVNQTPEEREKSDNILWNKFYLLNEINKNLEKQEAELRADSAQKEAELKEDLTKYFETASHEDVLNEAEMFVTSDVVHDDESQESFIMKRYTKDGIRKNARKTVRQARLNLPAATPVATSASVQTDTIAISTNPVILRPDPNINENTDRGGNLLEGTVFDPTFLADIIVNKVQNGKSLRAQAADLNSRLADIFTEDPGLTPGLLSALILRVGYSMIDDLLPALQDELAEYPSTNTSGTLIKVLEMIYDDETPEPLESPPDSWSFFKSTGCVLSRTGISPDGTPGLVICDLLETIPKEIRTAYAPTPYKLFVKTPSDASVTLFFHSLVNSCLNLGIDPRDYLVHLILNAGSLTHGVPSAWRALLPGRSSLQDARKHLQLIRKAKPDPTRTAPYILTTKKSHQ